MFMYRKTQYSSDVSFSQLDLQIQCIPNKILVSYLVNTKKVVLKITHRGKNPQKNPGGEKKQTNIKRSIWIEDLL